MSDKRIKRIQITLNENLHKKARFLMDELQSSTLTEPFKYALELLYAKLSGEDPNAIELPTHMHAISENANKIWEQTLSPRAQAADYLSECVGSHFNILRKFAETYPDISQIENATALDINDFKRIYGDDVNEVLAYMVINAKQRVVDANKKLKELK